MLIFIFIILYLHAEGFVALLQTAGRKELERVYILTVNKTRLLAYAQCTGGHEANSFGSDICECCFSSQGVHQKFSVQ